MTQNPKPEILIATRNAGKIREIREALRSSPVKLRLLEEFPKVSPIEEIGATYEENAVLKALGYSKQTGLVALADDSGLEVDALGGRPGVLSARFGGEHLSDRDRAEKLLLELSDYGDSVRVARFVCAMALAGWRWADKADGADWGGPRLLSVTEGICEGFITTGIRGVNGFGFDPVFRPNGYRETFAELPEEVKSKISHRALALTATREFLDRWVVQT